MSDISKFKSRRWLYMIMSLIICICAGFGYAWSVIQSPLVENFGWPESQVSLAYTVTVICSTMAPLFFGSLIRRMSIRTNILVGAVLFGGGLFLTGIMTQIWQLYFFYGILSGLGCGFIYPSMMAYVVRLFPEKTGMASGLGTAAYGSGAILWAPVAVAITGATSLSWAFRILGIAFLAVIFICGLFLSDPPEGYRESLCPAKETSTVEAEGLRRGQMIKKPAFYLILAIFTCGLIAGVIVISQASPILQTTLSYSASQAAVFVSIFAACNMAGRFIWGSLSDKLGLKNTITAVSILCVISMLALGFVKAEILVLIAMGLAASCYGGFASVLTPLTSKAFGPKYITENYGVMYVVFGIASLIGPSLAVGFKSAGGYTGAFFTAAGIAAVGLILSRFIRVGGKNGQ